jgi:hypothetical protein
MRGYLDMSRHAAPHVVERETTDAGLSLVPDHVVGRRVRLLEPGPETLADPATDSCSPWLHQHLTDPDPVDVPTVTEIVETPPALPAAPLRDPHGAAPKQASPRSDGAGVRFTFDGDVAGFARSHAIAGLVTVLTLGFAFPAGLVIVERWRARHLTVDGQRLTFDGSAAELFASWKWWWPLTWVSFGLYGFWVQGRVTRWVWSHMGVEAVWQARPEPVPPYLDRPLAPPVTLHTAFFADAGRHRAD